MTPIERAKYEAQRLVDAIEEVGIENIKIARLVRFGSHKPKKSAEEKLLP